MAKLKYSSPLIKFCPIPLSTAGGCAIQSNEADYVCVVQDPYTSTKLFVSSNNECEYIPADEEEANNFACYHVPLADINVYVS